jgi:outer membrane protein W
MRNQILACLFVLVCAIGAFAADDDEHREWEVSGFVGNSFPKDFHFSGTRMHFGSGYQIGIRLNDNVREHVAVDLEYAFAHQNLSFTNLAPAAENVSVTQYVHYLSYNVAYVWFPPRKRFRPYADGGVGTALFFLPQASMENALAQGVKLRDSWAFLVNCGGGFKYLIRDQFAVTVDVKDRLFKIPSYGLPLSVHGVGQTWQANVGLTFQWDEY